MEKHNLLSTLQFGYSPLSAFEFDKLRNDVDVQTALTNSVLYIIARRPLIQFCDYTINSDDYTISFNLSREDVNYKLSCKFYINSCSDLKNRKLKILSGSFSPDPNKIHGLKFYDSQTKEFLHWFNAEIFLYSVSHNYFKADIKGNMFDFMTFEVLYVGKCTDESITERFKNHHALQQILINENIITKDYQNSHDFVIIPFEYKDNTFIKTYDGSNIQNLIQDQQKVSNISNKKIALDEEKALIKCLNPKYNSVKYKAYPKSTDGLYKEDLGVITYSFAENIRLKYSEGSILGNVNSYDPSVSFIGVQGENAEVLNLEKL